MADTRNLAARLRMLAASVVAMLKSRIIPPLHYRLASEARLDGNERPAEIALEESFETRNDFYGNRPGRARRPVASAFFRTAAATTEATA